MLTPIIWSIEEFFWVDGYLITENLKWERSMVVVKLNEQTNQYTTASGKTANGKGAHKCENKYLI